MMGMDTITITLNGVEVSGQSGMTVLELARESGVDIPTLCDDPNLAAYGACRLCVVEEERTGALLASCVSPIRPGMVINTKSPRVLERRKILIQLMLASHPDSCMVCDKGNRCQLRTLAAEMGVGLIRYQRIPHLATIEEVNPFIERDLSKCIMCARCIRADQELVVEGAIDYINRGFASKPATLNDLPLEKSECTFCGTCVAMCPTGALKEKENTYRGTTTATVETVCPYCGCGCGISLEIKDERIVRVKPGKTSPVNHGALCVRGCYGYDFVHSPERLTNPLMKVNGTLQPVTWEQALEQTAAEIKRIKEQYGTDSLAVLGSSKCTNEENYLLQKFARDVLGTGNIDNGGRLYNSATGTALKTSSLEELEKADVIMVIGANPAVSAPAVGYALKRAVKKGARLVLVDVRKTKLNQFTHVWLQPGVGTDIALINGLAKVIVDEKLSERESDDFPAFRKSLEAYTPAYVEQVTGVPAQEVQLAARLLAGAKRVSIIYGNGITQQTGTDGVKAIANLAMLTGTAGILSLQRENNARGAAQLSGLWESNGLTAFEMMEQAAMGKLKGMLIVGENPASSFPHPSAVQKALASLEFLVVADMFLTETAKLATVVLPAASFAEKDGTFTNFEGRVQQVRKAIAPAGNSLPDGEIIVKLASKLEYQMPSSPQQIAEEIQKLAARAKSREIARFSPVQFAPPAKAPDGYPLTLLTGTILHHFGSGTRSFMASRLKKFSPRSWVEIGTADAERLGLNESNRVKIISSAGEATASVRITDTLPPGTLFMPISFPDSKVMELFDLQSPSLKSCAVRLERTS